MLCSLRQIFDVVGVDAGHVCHRHNTKGTRKRYKKKIQTLFVLENAQQLLFSVEGACDFQRFRRHDFDHINDLCGLFDGHQHAKTQCAGFVSGEWLTFHRRIPRFFFANLKPTWSGRGWFIFPFDGNPWWTAPLAIAPALLACILIFMDQQISAVIVNRKENKLKKGSCRKQNKTSLKLNVSGCGYHLDLLVLCFLIVIVGYLGLPIYVAATVLSINHVNSLKIESECRAPGEVSQFVGVRYVRMHSFVCLFQKCRIFLASNA